MRSEHIQKIKKRGYWRVNFQPLVDRERLTLPQTREIVDKNAVKLRGWDYPHIPRREDETHGLEAHSTFYQGWTDWAYYKEFWRMYQSGQFLHYMGLREDWEDEASGMWANKHEVIEPGTKLNVISSVIYELTEIFEFLSRLSKDGIYDDGVRISISLVNTANRALWITDPRRLDFTIDHKTILDKIEFNRTYEKETLIAKPHDEARAAMKYFFERFGWDNPSEDVLISDQEQLLKGFR